MTTELWQLVSLEVVFLGAISALAKLFFDQMQRRMDERFKVQEESRAANHAQLSKRLEGIETAAREDANHWQRLEREVLNLKAELPLHYVRREDYVLAIATIMTKLDAMALRFENILLKGQRNEH